MNTANTSANQNPAVTFDDIRKMEKRIMDAFEMLEAKVEAVDAKVEVVKTELKGDVEAAKRLVFEVWQSVNLLTRVDVHLSHK